MLKKVLVLGSGLVVKPGVQYLAESGFSVTLATRTVEKANEVINLSKKESKKSLKITPETLDVANDPKKLEKLVKENNFVVSLLPYNFHPEVAKVAIKHRKHFFTTSYVSDAIKELGNAAEEAGIIMINECGVDPGTDHMSAMRVIDDVTKNNGKITSFLSYCGGLPAPDNNDNPFGYKFSWSAKGVLLASRNNASFLKDGKDVTIPGKDLFDNYQVEQVGDIGKFEVYPNRDSKQYIDIYGIKDTQSIIRGTYRNIGWCRTIKKIADLGYLSIEEDSGIAGKTYAEVMKTRLLGLESTAEVELKKEVANKLAIDTSDKVISDLEWVGAFSDTEKIPSGTTSLIDALCHIFQNKMVYKEGERDMLLMQHKFTADYEDRVEYLTSTMVDYGIKDGDSSMSRTVSLPVAIAVRLVAEGKINATGLKIPTTPDLYNPILDELDTLGVKFVEKTEKVVMK